MPLHLVHEPAFQRAVILLLPFLIAASAILVSRPRSRTLAGVFLGSLWNFTLLVPANLLAFDQIWWSYGSAQPALLHVPLDILLGWSVWWGAALPLLWRGRHFFLALGLAVGIDILAMPQLSPTITVGENWLWGEAFVLLVGFAPGWFIAHATKHNRYLGARAAMQAVITGLLFYFLLPAVLLDYYGQHIGQVATWPTWQSALVANLLLLPIILGLAGSQEFAGRGRGTPIPFDPPQHLVVTGPYAYIANPMQLSIVLGLALLGVTFGSWLIMAAGLMAVIYCLGVVRWHHTIDLEPRFGSQWRQYCRAVPLWLPRWRPWVREPATVFFARHCTICTDTEHWLLRLKPDGLLVHDAATHAKRLRRVTYRYPDGSEVEGIAAIAACLNHVNLAFAFLGWFMRLPVICQFLQIVVDGCGERAKAAG